MPMDLNYDIEFLGNAEKPVLSADVAQVFGTFAAMFVFQLLLLAYTSRALYKLQQTDNAHPVAGLLWVSVLFQCCGLMVRFLFQVIRDGSDKRIKLLLAYYVDTGSSGIESGIGMLYYMGMFLLGNAELLFLLHLILLAKGWAIVRHKISTTGTVKIAIYFTAYYCTFWFLSMWTVYFADDALISFVYSTGPGLIMILLRCIAGLWFNYACYTTRRGFKRKLGFYKKFAAGGTVWIMWLPFSALIASVYDSHRQKPVLNWSLLFGSFAGHFIMTILFYPDKNSEMFPFHQMADILGQTPSIANASSRCVQVREKGVAQAPTRARIPPRKGSSDIKVISSVALKRISQSVTNVCISLFYYFTANAFH